MCAVALEMPSSIPSSLSLTRSCGPIAGLATTSAAARYSVSPSQHSSRTLDSSLWRKQVCEVRPNRSSTLGRCPVGQQSSDGGERGVAADDKATTMTPRLSTDSLTSVTATKTTDESLPRPRAPRPPPRSSSDCCRCRWLRAVSTSLPPPDPVRCGHPFRRSGLDGDGCQERSTYSNVELPPPPPPPQPHSATRSSALASSAPSSAVQDFCVRVPQTDSFATGSSSAGCLLHADSAHLRTADVGLCTVVADGSARYCLEDITEMDETPTINQSNTSKPPTAEHPSVTASDQRTLATSCTVTTFV